MVTLYDKYVAQEGINTIFSYIGNSDIVARPSRIGFESQTFFLCKRPGLETKTVDGLPVWKTEGDIMESKTFESKEFFYTSQGYVYSFDGNNLVAVPTNPSNINNVTQNSDFILNKAVNVEYIGQEFTPGTDILLINAKFRLKKEVGSTDTAYINAYISTAAAKNVVLGRATNTIYSSDLTTSYVTYTFTFNAIKLTAATKYFVYLDVGGSTGTSRVLANINSTDVFGGGTNQAYQGTNTQVWAALTGDMWFEVSGTLPNLVNTSIYDQNILEVSYVSGVRYPDAITQLNVSSYNPTTLTITTVETTLTSAYIGKYVYIIAGKGQYQQRSIVDIPANNQIVVSSDFNVVPDATSDIQFFTGITKQLWFTQIRKGATTPDVNFCLSIDNNGVTKWIYMPERRQLQFWDNRVVQLTKDNQALLFSSNIDYEIPILTKVEFGNAQALSFSPYGSYLIVYFANKIGLVKKDIIDAGTGSFAYLYQDLLDFGAYSAYSFKVKSGQLIVTMSDNQVYTLDLSTISLGDVMGKPEPLSDAIMSELNKLEGGDIRIFYNKRQLRVVWRGTTTSKVFKYYEVYKGWIIDDYNFGGNFHEFLYTIGNKQFTCAGDIIYQMSGLQDNGVNYKQSIKMYGPVEGEGSVTQFQHASLRMGFDGVNKLSGKGVVYIGGYKMKKKEYDFSKLGVIKDINLELEKDGSVGTGIWGEYIYGGDSEAITNILAVYPEIFYTSLGVYLKGQHYTVELYNDDNKQMYIGGIEVINNAIGKQVTVNKGRA